MIEKSRQKLEKRWYDAIARGSKSEIAQGMKGFTKGQKTQICQIQLTFS